MSADSPAAAAENPVHGNENGLPSGKSRSRQGSYSQKSGGYLPDIHRALPQSIDAEKGVLCSVLLEPGKVLDESIASGITERHFHLPAHQLIFSTLIEMNSARKPIDSISLTQYLDDRKQLASIGGAVAISELLTFIPTAANAEYYREILQEKFLLRQVITTCNEFSARCYDEQGDAETLLQEVERNVLAIGDERLKGQTPEMKEMVFKAIEGIEKLYHNRGGITGLPTGFSELDKMTSGLHEGEMFVIAARPSMGKTALAMNIAEHVAVEAGKPVAIFSLEMSSQQLVQRLLCSLARVDLARVRDGFLGKQDFPNIISAADRLSKAQMFVDDTPGMSILELCAKSRRLHNRQGIELIVIDYLQLLRSPSKRAQENRQIEVAEISFGIKALAKELKIPIIVLAQLNRNPESRSGDSKGRPRLSDLRESGSIEQDADVVGLLWREDYYADDDEARKESEGRAELIIAKQRNGPTGDVALSFLKQFTRFEDGVRDREEPAR